MDAARRVFGDWRSGAVDARFPAGRASPSSSRRCDAVSPVVVHGANLRCALPDLTGAVDPGHDLPLGRYATLAATADGIRLIEWPEAT